MQNFISHLIQRNRDLLNTHVSTNGADDVGTDIESTLTTLAIAHSSLAKLALLEKGDSLPLQCVVIGPTQVGKSTMVNLLLQEPVAEASAEAGFTVHCQGFHVLDSHENSHTGVEDWASTYFDGLRLSEQRSLDRQVLGEYSLQDTVIQGSVFNGSVFWDTPDFDSIRSFDYRAPLLKAIALADLVVFVVSKEKYADKTVWTMLELLADLATPVVVVLNKTPATVSDELKESFEQKYSKAFPLHELPPLSVIDDYPAARISTDSMVETQNLRERLQVYMGRPDSSVCRENTVKFLRHHWSQWTTGIKEEHRLHREYEALVESIVANTLQRYRAEYVDSDRHREVIQLALSELLVLLEVPGMAKPLSKIRSVVTWPVRTLLANAKEPLAVKGDDRNEERRLLDELGKHALATVIAEVAQREADVDGTWWQQMRKQVESADAEINNKYSKGLDNYQTMLQVEIDRAAQSLYQNLQTQPATLNSLRAARVTADAAAVVLAVKSGGLGAVDLVVAPAMLSLTTLLTEGALGQYMNRIQDKLTAYQEKEVRSLVNRRVRKPLLTLAPSTLGEKSSLISEEELQRMGAKLESGDV